MKILRTAQVCVIDDEPREYLYLLAALNSLGLGCVHVRGDKVEELPEEQFRGLRLVFLDMHLGTQASMGSRAVTAHTANAFSRVVSPESAPIVVVVWTKFSELISSFRNSLFEQFPEFRGKLFFIRMEKPRPPARIDKDQLRIAVEHELSQLQHLPLLWNWDSVVQRASCSVTSELCKLAVTQAQLNGAEDEAEERDKMLSALSFILRLLLLSEAGKDASSDVAATTLLNVLGPLHTDRIDSLSPHPDLDGAAELLAPVTTPHEPTQSVIVALNTMLLTGAHYEAGAPFRPGTIYHISDTEAFHATTGVAIRDMVDEMCQKAILEPQNAAQLQTWMGECRPVLVEISPACDYSQRKRPVARFVCGLLVPRASAGKIKTSPAKEYNTLRKLCYVTLSNIDPVTEWLPVFSSGFVIGLRENSPVPFLTPIARLKESVLADLRNWISSQGARFGYLSINDRS